MTTIICPHCGKDVNEDAAFCTACGGALELPTPVEEERAEIPVKKGTPTWWRVIRCIFSIPLTVLLVAALLLFTTLSAVRNIPQKNTVKSLFKEIEPTKMIAEALTKGESDSFATVIYDAYEQAAAESGLEDVLTEKELQKVLDASTLDEFLSDKTADYLSAFLSGDNDVAVTKDELLNLVRENEAVIEQVTGGKALTEEHYTMLEEAIDESGIVEQLDMSKVLPEADTAVIDTVQLAYNEAFYAAIALCLALVLLIALFNLCGHFLTSLYSGIALLLAGAVASLTLAVETVAVDIITTAGLPFSSNVLSAVVHTALSGFWQVGFCLIGGGVLCIALFAVMRIIRRRRTAM